MVGGVIVPFPGEVKDYPSKMTLFVFFTCLVAAAGGLNFGYDIGISGGVTSMDSFLRKFFPKVYLNDKEADEDTISNQYCKFDSQLLTTFTSSLYLAALIASWFASSMTRTFGRKWSMFIGGIAFLAGAILNGAATNVALLIIGRIFLGVGVGFANQSVPVYLSEMAPAKLRGMLNIGFQLMITLGILCANLVNYGTAKIDADWGWRLGLALATVPSVFITLSSLFIPDTPNSLIERGHESRAFSTLCKIRGTSNIQQEFADLKAASYNSMKVKHPWFNIAQRRYRPHLTMAILIPIFQQLTGINAIMFYAPVLFKTIGFGNDASLISALITGLVNVFATLFSIFTADQLGRRSLFFMGGVQMFVSQIIVGTLIGAKFGVSGQGHLSLTYASAVVAFICIHVAGFAWSWGPLGSLVPSEIFPLEIRSAGLSITVSVSMFFTFVIAQSFLTLLCKLQFRLFYLFGVWLAIMTTFIYFFLPETKGVPIEEMVLVWKAHWFWGSFITDQDFHVGARLGNTGGQMKAGSDEAGPSHE